MVLLSVHRLVRLSALAAARALPRFGALRGYVLPTSSLFDYFVITVNIRAFGKDSLFVSMACRAWIRISVSSWSRGGNEMVGRGGERGVGCQLA